MLKISTSFLLFKRKFNEALKNKNPLFGISTYINLTKKTVIETKMNKN